MGPTQLGSYHCRGSRSQHRNPECPHEPCGWGNSHGEEGKRGYDPCGKLKTVVGVDGKINRPMTTASVLKLFITRWIAVVSRSGFPAPFSDRLRAHTLQLPPLTTSRMLSRKISSFSISSRQHVFFRRKNCFGKIQ